MALSSTKENIKRFCLGEKMFVPGGFLFSKGVYFWFLLMAVFYSPLLDIVFGPDSYVFRTAQEPSLLKNLAYRLNYAPKDAYVIYTLHVVSLLLILFNASRFIPDFNGENELNESKINKAKLVQGIKLFLEVGVRATAWISGLILARSAFLIGNAGLLLAYNWAFFLIIYFPKSNSNWKIVLSNFSLLGCKIQFLIVYAFAAIYKWREPDWLSGDSIHYLSLTDHYTPSWLCSLLQMFSPSMVVLNYFILIYLTIFPLLVWFKRFRNPLITVGIAFHLYTMFVMKLYDFGLIMILGYLLFLDEDTLSRIKKKILRKRLEQG